jgi:hypothetical protein
VESDSLGFRTLIARVREVTLGLRFESGHIWLAARGARDVIEEYDLVWNHVGRQAQEELSPKLLGVQRGSRGQDQECHEAEPFPFIDDADHMRFAHRRQASDVG